MRADPRATWPGFSSAWPLSWVLGDYVGPILLVLRLFSGDPLFLEPYWRRNAARSAVLVAGWHRMSYRSYGDSPISLELERYIRLLHDAVGNAVTDGRFIVFGIGSSQLLNAAVHSLSTDAVNVNSSSSPASVVATVPFYGLYKSQTEFFDSRVYEWEGAAANWVNSSASSSSKFVEFVTSPNNPDGLLMKSVLDGSSVIHDHAYYWPHYTAIPTPADEEVMTFTASKVSGHAGSRFGSDFYPPGFAEPTTVPGFPVDPPGSPVFGRFMCNPVLEHGPDRIGARSAVGPVRPAQVQGRSLRKNKRTEPSGFYSQEDRAELISAQVAAKGETLAAVTSLFK
ncbi:Tryptophan aminotransferase-related protein 4 [Platanthera guangdongensis]|uniref:Tryptophan aminotransferase-related protein 4 n=1 Tax=Platanthera guangdongensis TaxID=2320717 RepID=A0ABR2LJL7_9ASPA